MQHSTLCRWREFTREREREFTREREKWTKGILRVCGWFQRAVCIYDCYRLYLCAHIES
jgi:hypothetical protein